MKKHRESHWGKPFGLGPQLAPPTEFEQTVRSLKLAPRQYKTSPQLKEWVRQNKNGKYVPPDLLKEFGFEVTDEF